MPGNYSKYLIKEEEKKACLKCGKFARYERYGYTWCEEHKSFLDEDPESLETIVIERLKNLGI